MVDLLASAEFLASLDRPAVGLDETRCLHRLCKNASCEQCFTVCPSGAIQPGKPPALDAKACEKCLACLPACPSGAFQADDSVPAMLDCLARLEAHRVELVCQQHEQANQAAAGADGALQIRGCLAGIGVGGYLVLAAMSNASGVEAIITRLDACQGCAWKTLQPQVVAQIETARRILKSWGQDGFLEIAGPENLTPGAVDARRAVWNVHNPPLSRRDFFRLATRQGQLATARLLNQKENRPAERQPNKDRRRIVAGVCHLQPAALHFSLDGLGFGSLAANDHCTACGVCAALCPTSALVFEREEEKSYQLSFFPTRCIGCGLCLEVCAPEALALDRAPTSQMVFEMDEPVLLQQGPLARCERCSALIAARRGIKYCPVCEFRRKNPLGSALPPGYKKRS